jgi:hypothetical protein
MRFTLYDVFGNQCRVGWEKVPWPTLVELVANNNGIAEL